MLKIIEDLVDLQQFVENCYKLNKKIALVPTMGALHFGHLSLIELAMENAEVALVSIFVNPLQFNNQNDLARYPRKPQQDAEIIAKYFASTNFNSNKEIAVFIPPLTVIYPQLPKISFNSPLFDILCGKDRPGHFAGVCMVVTKLFNLTKAHYAIFGEKDFQQLQIIKQLVSDLNFSVKIISAPTIREQSQDFQGLAMSSRNQLLSIDGKKKATIIFKQMNYFANNFCILCWQYQNKIINFLQIIDRIREIIENCKKEIIENGFDRVDYFALLDVDNFVLFDPKMSEADFKNICNNNLRVFVASAIENVRLIDNLKIDNNSKIQ